MTNDVFNRKVGETIKTIRKAMQISQSTLAKELSITPQQVHKYETGVNNINTEMIWKIANVLRCDIGIFFPKKEKSNSNILKIAENKNELCVKKKNKNDDAILLLKNFFKLSKDDKEKLLKYSKDLISEKKK